MNSLVPAPKKSLTKTQHVDRIANRGIFAAGSGVAAGATVAADFVVPGIPVIDGLISLAQLVAFIATGGGVFATVRAYYAAKNRYKRR